MATGSNRRLIWNSREQVTSSDLNRAQAFQSGDLGELFRFFVAEGSNPGFLPGANDPIAFDWKNGFTEDHAVQETPMYGQVIGGFTASTVLGTMNIKIDAGVAFVVDPDASPQSDDSPYKLVRDSGTTITVPTADLSQTRIDVIEVSRKDVITVTDSRNQYDTATGLFTPVTVNKAGMGQFTWRIRSAAAGAGTPSPVAGWMPLYVVSVPANTTDTSSMKIWDVRPLISGRSALVNRVASHGQGHLKQTWGSGYLSGSNLMFQGYAEVHDQYGYRLGGQLLGKQAVINFGNTFFQAAGFTPGAGNYYYVYIGIPITANVNAAGSGYMPNLGPRWALMANIDVGSPYRPFEPVGLIVISTTPPDESGKALLTTPSVTGLNSSMTGHMVGMGWVTAGGALTGFMMKNGRLTLLANSSGSEPTISTTPSANVATFSLTPNTHFPRNAKGIYASFSVPFTTLNGNLNGFPIIVTTASQANTSNYEVVHQVECFGPNAALATVVFSCYLPIDSLWYTGDQAQIIKIQQHPSYTAYGNIPASAAQMTITGFEF